jgi:hypothetical protein
MNKQAPRPPSQTSVGVQVKVWPEETVLANKEQDHGFSARP